MSPFAKHYTYSFLTHFIICSIMSFILYIHFYVLIYIKKIQHINRIVFAPRSLYAAYNMNFLRLFFLLLYKDHHNLTTTIHPLNHLFIKSE